MDFKSNKTDELEAIDDLISKLKTHLELVGLEKIVESV